jgi:hypothetical protein
MHKQSGILTIIIVTPIIAELYCQIIRKVDIVD